MPELPEVQTVIATLSNQVQENKIVGVEIITPSIVQQDSLYFSKMLTNQRIKAFQRRGKYIILVLDQGYCVMHLRMEGRFYLEDNRNAKKHVHVIFKLDDGRHLHYHDTRKFGRMIYLKDKQILDDYLSHIGIEYDDPNFSGKYLYDLAHSKKRSLKSFLLAQEFIAGIGNIYADEICFYAKAHPATPCHLISRRQWNKIAEATVEIFEKAIADGGTTIYSYINSEGISGRFQLSLQVHHRKDEACYICQSKIIKTVVANRGTYLCPKCQKLKSL